MDAFKRNALSFKNVRVRCLIVVRDDPSDWNAPSRSGLRLLNSKAMTEMTSTRN